MSIKERILQVQAQVRESALQAGRDPDRIKILVVSKYATIPQMQEAYEAGVRCFGESRLQEALPKIEAMPKDIEWHFIGHIQSNKASKIVSHFAYLHSVDSIRLAKVLSEEGIKRNKKVSCFIQLNLSREQSKQGFSLEEFESIYPSLFELEGLYIAGLMTIGPHTEDENSIRDCFRQLKDVQERVAKKIKNGLCLSLSMGMSHDYKIAIEEGSSWLRMGSMIFS